MDQEFLNYINDAVKRADERDVCLCDMAGDAERIGKYYLAKGAELYNLAEQCRRKQCEHPDLARETIRLKRLALQAYDAAVDLDAPHSWRDRARTRYELAADLAEQQHFGKANEMAKGAVNDYGIIVDAHPAYRSNLGDAWCRAAQYHLQIKEYAQAEQAALQALAFYQKTPRGSVVAAERTAKAHHIIALSCFYQKRYADAEKAVNLALPLYGQAQRIAATGPKPCELDKQRASVLGALLLVKTKSAVMLPIRNINVVIGSLEKAIANKSKPLDFDMKEYRRARARAFYALGMVGVLNENEDFTIMYMRTAVHEYAQLAEDYPEDHSLEIELGDCCLTIGHMHAKMRNFDKARKALQEAVDQYAKATVDEDVYVASKCEAYYDLGCLHAFLGNYAVAMANLQCAVNQSISDYRNVTKSAILPMAYALEELGDVYRTIRKPLYAKTIYQTALECTAKCQGNVEELIKRLYDKVSKLEAV